MAVDARETGVGVEVESQSASALASRPGATAAPGLPASAMDTVTSPRGVRRVCRSATAGPGDGLHPTVLHDSRPRGRCRLQVGESVGPSASVRVRLLQSSRVPLPLASRKMVQPARPGSPGVLAWSPSRSSNFWPRISPVGADDGLDVSGASGAPLDVAGVVPGDTVEGVGAAGWPRSRIRSGWCRSATPVVAPVSDTKMTKLPRAEPPSSSAP